MKYYSELTNEFYDSESACKAAESIAEKEKKEKEEEERLAYEIREKRLAEVNAAGDALQAARKTYTDLLVAYYKDYGYFSSFKF